MLICSLQVRRTQRAIKQVLTERYYSWEDARDIAKDDAEVDLSGQGPAYTPGEIPQDQMFEEEDVDEELAAAEKEWAESEKEAQLAQTSKPDGGIPPTSEGTTPTPPAR